METVVHMTPIKKMWQLLDEMNDICRKYIWSVEQDEAPPVNMVEICTALKKLEVLLNQTRDVLYVNKASLAKDQFSYELLRMSIDLYSETLSRCNVYTREILENKRES